MILRNLADAAWSYFLWIDSHSLFLWWRVFGLCVPFFYHFNALSQHFVRFSLGVSLADAFPRSRDEGSSVAGSNLRHVPSSVRLLQAFYIIYQKVLLLLLPLKSSLNISIDGCEFCVTSFEGYLDQVIEIGILDDLWYFLVAFKVTHSLSYMFVSKYKF